MKIQPVIVSFTFMMLCSAPYVVRGQNIFSEKFDNCVTDKFSLEYKISMACDLKKLSKHIIGAMDRKLLEKLRGELDLQILVDTLGKPCCLSVQNKTAYPTADLRIAEIINSSKVWGLPAEKVSVWLRITFHKDYILLQRIGHNARTGNSELASYKMKK